MSGQQRRWQGTGGGRKESVFKLVHEAKEMMGDEDLCWESVVTVFEVFSRMDNLL